MSVKRCNKRREKAALLVAEDRFPDRKIAEMVGITERQLDRWKHEVLFQSRVHSITRAYSERALKCGLARKENRLRALSDMHDRLLTIIEERAVDPDLAEVSGGKTGLVTRTLKGIGKG